MTLVIWIARHLNRLGVLGEGGACCLKYHCAGSVFFKHEVISNALLHCKHIDCGGFYYQDAATPGSLRQPDTRLRPRQPDSPEV